MIKKQSELGVCGDMEDLSALVTELAEDEFQFVYGGMQPADGGKGGKGCSWTSGADGKKKCDEWNK